MNAADGYWWYITINTSAGCEDNLLSLADISGSIGTELQEMPDGVSRLRMYYKSTEDISFWRNKLSEAMKEFPGVAIEDSGKIENQPWNVVVEEAFPPLPVGRGLVVLAPWHRGTEPADRIPLYINPGSAFGTGYHESTQIVLELLEKYMRGKTPDRTTRAKAYRHLLSKGFDRDAVLSALSVLAEDPDEDSPEGDGEEV